MNRDLNKIVLCIGTSKCIGDSLGPLVGEILCEKINNPNIYILGNIKNNITYQNVDVIFNKIKKQIKRPYYIMVDSALSTNVNIGKIIVNYNKMTIGSALSKSNFKLGNLSIKGVVGENKFNKIKNYDELNSVSGKLIKNLSISISNKIIEILKV